MDAPDLQIEPAYEEHTILKEQVQYMVDENWNQPMDINIDDGDGNDVKIKGSAFSTIQTNFMESEVNQAQNIYKQFGQLLVPLKKMTMVVNKEDKYDASIKLDANLNQSVSIMGSDNKVSAYSKDGN